MVMWRLLQMYRTVKTTDKPAASSGNSRPWLIIHFFFFSSLIYPFLFIYFILFILNSVPPSVVLSLHYYFNKYFNSRIYVIIWLNIDTKNIWLGFMNIFGIIESRHKHTLIMHLFFLFINYIHVHQPALSFRHIYII